ncbi:MAG: HigA family addiction module antitoxin, partial [Chlamydiota bacterium]
SLARALSVPVNRITSILNEKRAITADTALRLSKFFGTTAQFWLNLQLDFDLKTTMKKKGKKIEKEVRSCHQAA